jgi:hypothetical protein
LECFFVTDTMSSGLLAALFDFFLFFTSELDFPPE